MSTPTITAAVIAELKADIVRQQLACVNREIAAFADKGRNKLHYTQSYFGKLQKRREELQKQLTP
jgi:hypothetical protein